MISPPSTSPRSSRPSTRRVGAAGCAGTRSPTSCRSCPRSSTPIGDHALCGGAVSRLGGRGETSCQYALYLLRWLEQPPEAFLVGPVVDAGDARLPAPGPDSRLRWDLAQLHAAVNDERQRQALTWARLADRIGCTPGRLTGLRTARLADMALTMRLTQWVRRPAADFIHPASSQQRAELL